jgi:hypothetical protein
MAEPTAGNSIMLATAAETSTARRQAMIADLSPLVRRTAHKVREGSANITSLVANVTASSVLARLAFEAVHDAHAFESDGTPIPPVSAAMLLQALWEHGATWDDGVVVVCGSFCSFSDLMTIAGHDPARDIGSANLPIDVAHAVAVCLEKNPHTPLSDVRTAVLASVR